MADNKKYHMHPFAYGFYHNGEGKIKSDEEKYFYTFMEQREASYTEAAETVFNNRNLDEGVLFWDTFRNGTEAPTPPIMYVDGYKSAKEIANEDNSEKE